MSNADERKPSLSISELLHDKRYPIADLCKKAKSIQEIDHNLKKYLDKSLHDHFEVANIKTDSAILLVNSSSWATRLRYNIPAILDALNNHLNFSSIKTITIKVNTLITDNTSKSRPTMTLSKNSAKVLADVANNFNDPQLRECILKISKNYQK